MIFTRKILALLILLLCLSIIFIIAILYTGLNNIPREKMVMKSVTFDDLKQLPAAEPSIVYAQEAISYAINLDLIHDRLEQAVLKGLFRNWNVSAQLINKDGLNWWEVKIKSSSDIPYFECYVSFTPEGELASTSSAEGCKYYSRK